MAEGARAEPWWSAGDDEFAGATPLFDGPAAEASEDPSGSGPDDASESGESTPRGSANATTPVAEALKLAAALSAWADETGLSDTLRSLAGEAAQTLAAASPESGSTSAEHLIAGATSTCDYCPLCRGIDVMRMVQPQVSQGLTEAMASLTAALNGAIDTFAANQRRS